MTTKTLTSSQAQIPHDHSLHHHRPIIRTAYGPHIHSTLVCPEQPFGRTKQSFKDETDLNWIMARFQKTGVIDFVNKRSPQFGDVTGIEFQAAMQLVIDAEAMFADLPSKVRDRFGNDPQNLLHFLEDPANRSEAQLLGLIDPPATPLAGTPPQAEQGAGKPLSAAGEGGGKGA